MDPQSLLKPIDPPAGGLDGLRRAIHRRQRRRQGVMTVMTLAVLVAATWWVVPRAPRVAPLPAGDFPLVRLAAHEPQAPVRVFDGTAIEWPQGSARTRIYWVDSDGSSP